MQAGRDNFYVALCDMQLMGIQIDPKYGGSGSTFFSSIIAIEELAKVDPSVSVLCDVQNTLIIDYFQTYGSEQLKEKYFPQLATNMVWTCMKMPLLPFHTVHARKCPCSIPHCP